MTEALVYIGAVMVLLGVAVVAMHRCIDNSLVLRRNADDISRVMHMGERWRADVRNATKETRLEQKAGEQVLRLERPEAAVEYRFSQSAVYRRVGGGPWSRVLDRVKSSSMHSEMRSQVTAWHWDIELLPQGRGAAHASRVRPLFSFLAVPTISEHP